MPVEGAKAAEQKCPSCGELVFPGEDFCEACGHRLTPGGRAGPPPPPAPVVPAGPACVGCGTGTIDADGYCEQCGLRQPAERDHVEIELPGRIAAAASDRGKRYSRNEDAIAIAEHPGGVAVVVSDGVGSSQRPDDASRAAADSGVAELVARLAGGSGPEDAMRAAVASAAEAVAALAESPAEAPSCTFVSAVTTPGRVTVGWVGDSRAYWLSAAGDGSPLDTLPPNTLPPGEAGSAGAADLGDTAEMAVQGPDGESELRASRALTEDDSWAAFMVAEGALTEAEAEAHPNAHVITGWLGADAEEVRPHIATFGTDPGAPGTLLVCSDGLWNYLPHAQDLAAVLAGSGTDPAADPLGAAQALVRRALDAGGRDNITVAVIPLPPSLPSPSSDMGPPTNMGPSSDMERER
ncbi:protein phosphatase 2C domain-containing protein [Actinomadura sp. 9N407]|uniref:protein phosphatase 2C domain-containing protein n=1 Tax=Actinomadura sp. 9N407 TaxID=3375154 RepID=UPI00378FAD75